MTHAQWKCGRIKRIRWIRMKGGWQNERKKNQRNVSTFRMWSRGLSFCTDILSVCARLKMSFNWSLENMLTDRMCCPISPWLPVVMDGTYRFGLLSLLWRTVLANRSGDTHRAPACSFMYSFKSSSGVGWLPVLTFVSHRSFEYMSGSERTQDFAQADVSQTPLLLKTITFTDQSCWRSISFRMLYHVTVPVLPNVLNNHSAFICKGQAFFFGGWTLEEKGTMIFENNRKCPPNNTV